MDGNDEHEHIHKCTLCTSSLMERLYYILFILTVIIAAIDRITRIHKYLYGNKNIEYNRYSTLSISIQNFRIEKMGFMSSTKINEEKKNVS